MARQANHGIVIRFGVALLWLGTRIHPPRSSGICIVLIQSIISYYDFKEVTLSNHFLATWPRSGLRPLKRRAFFHGTAMFQASSQIWWSGISDRIRQAHIDWLTVRQLHDEYAPNHRFNEYEKCISNAMWWDAFIGKILKTEGIF